MNHHNVAILGTGPAGYTAAIYSGRAGLSPVIFEGTLPGGQLTNTTDVMNFPGFPHGILGSTLMEGMCQQARTFGAKIIPGEVTKVDLTQHPFRLTAGDTIHTCFALIIATGASAKWLGLGTDLELSRSGGGVSACATCDGFFYRGQEVAVVGGGDTALEEALYLTRFASQVHLVHRRNSLRASKVMQDRVFANSKIKIHWNLQVEELTTYDVISKSGISFPRINGIRLKDTMTGNLSVLRIDGLFVAIGHEPNTNIVKGQLDLDENGYIKLLYENTHTSIPGVFAAGDVSDSIYRQAITAAGRGCMAAIDAERWLAAYGPENQDQGTVSHCDVVTDAPTKLARA